MARILVIIFCSAILTGCVTTGKTANKELIALKEYIVNLEDEKEEQQNGKKYFQNQALFIQCGMKRH